MAHTCPVCGQTCYCNGDIDDIILDTEEAVAKCTHCSEYEDDSSQCDYCDAAVRADKAAQERDEAVAAVKEQDAALAQMREALEFYVEDERELCLTLGCNDCKTGSLANTCRDAKRTGAARTALSADSGKATLEYIKGLEADNEAMRGLLKKIRDAISTCESCDLPQHDDEDRCDTCINVHLDAIDAFLKGGGQE